MVFVKFFQNDRKIIVKSALQRISRPNVVDRTVHTEFSAR